MLWAAVAWVLINLVGAVMVVRDKRAARRQDRRTPENAFHVFAALGGGPLMVVAMRIVRHKTRKRSFQAPFAVASALGVALWFAVFWWMIRGVW